MWPRFGVKVGNSTLCVGSLKESGKVGVIANECGDRTSEAVLYCNSSNEIEIGFTAKQKLLSKFQSGVCNSFQLFPNDLSSEEILNSLKYVSCKYDTCKRVFCIQTRDENTYKEMSAFDVCVVLFKACFELAKQSYVCTGRPSVVLSVPDYFPVSCWSNLADAAENAGFIVSQVISEASAALVAYELIEYGEDTCNTKYVICIKSGGLITYVTLFKVFFNTYSVIGSSQPFYLGGNQFTNILVDFIAAEFFKKSGLNPKENKRSMAKIKIAADKCKHSLTTLPSTQVYIDSLMDGIDFNIHISRAKFENLIQPIINEFLRILNISLEEINKDKQTIHEIIFIGGATKVPKIQEVVKSKFENVILKSNLIPDEVVAIGCARQSGFVNPKDTDLNQKMCCKLITEDVYIWCNNNFDGRKRLVKKGTILPYNSVVNLEPSNYSDSGNIVFNIQYKNTYQQIQMNNTNTETGIYHIQALVHANLDTLQVELKLL